MKVYNNKNFLFLKFAIILKVLSLSSNFPLEPKKLHLFSRYETQKVSKLMPDCPESNFLSLIDQTKYNVTLHETTTTDGYILRMYRVRLNDDKFEKLPSELKINANQPILFVHGLEDSSDSPFVGGEERGFGNYLVNKGFDLWLGNNRGNKYSRKHTNPNITDEQFFDYSWQEMSQYDLRAFYEEIHRT